MDSIQAFRGGYEKPPKMISSTSIWKRTLLFSAISILAVWAHFKTPAKAVDIIVINTAKTKAGGKLFEAIIGEDKGIFLAKQASDFVQNLLYSNPKYPRKNVTQIILSIDNYTKIAVTDEYVIHISDEYIADYVGDLEGEIMGLIYREMGRVWLWNGGGEAPLTLIEGMAEYLRLSAGLYPSQTYSNAETDHGSDGQQMAKYLQYCESVKSGFVAEFNGRLEEKWNTDLFAEFSMEEKWGEFLMSVTAAQSSSSSAFLETQKNVNDVSPLL
ncbi:hypothetical protein SUGI_0762310 [Cryptomeria japonica]|uniref:uncharacterized protein LOC131071159 n=1 Tax=Cryptomeria japonica TaxID=3369 RepID=UPI00241474E9|nr:uncharacterized protein LOC131071159 [Cryptomeria japonica]GLJ37515.1 hypothetical protein SUGI_0762310 [Cryptomeria japonica]